MAATSLRLNIPPRFGFNTTISQLLTVPPYVCASTQFPLLECFLISHSTSACLLLTFAYLSDRWKIRSPFILAGLILCLIGFTINISDVSIGVKYFGTFFCVCGAYAAFPGIVAWQVPGPELSKECPCD